MNKYSILSMYEANISQSAKYDGIKSRISEYMEINKALYKCNTLACSKNIYPGGSQIAEKGRKILQHLECQNSRKVMVGWKSGKSAPM